MLLFLRLIAVFLECFLFRFRSVIRNLIFINTIKLEVEAYYKLNRRDLKLLMLTFLREFEL